MNNDDEQQQSKRLPLFYIALCCCVIVIGAAGYFVERNNGINGTELSENAVTDEETNPEIVAANEAVSNVDAGTPVPVAEIFVPTAVPTIADAEPETDASSDIASEAAEASAEDYESEDYENDDTAAEGNDDAATEYEDDDDAAADSGQYAEETAVIVGNPTFALPAQGEIVGEFSDTLQYNSALADWRTHDGIDIAVDSGCSIAAAADGTVKEISSDAMGDCITIEHVGDFVSKYRCLSSIESISEGDSIAAGDVIGIVCESKAESVLEPHLHFELYKSGILVNPADYLQF